MPKWSLRDLWGKRTEKEALNPEMRDMLLKLDGVYDTPVAAPSASAPAAAPEQRSAPAQDQ